MAKLVDAPDLGSGEKSWEFESLLGHHIEALCSVVDMNALAIQRNRGIRPVDPQSGWAQWIILAATRENTEYAL